MTLYVKHLACERGENRLFEQCTFQVQPGDWIQIEGHNGIGKTSLLHILSGLALPADGQILWQNQPLSRVREEYVHQLFYLGHQAGIKPELTPWENLCFFQKMQGKPCDEDLLWHALSQVDLIGREDLPCSHLSAGQQRRVALAKLWLTHATLWILDEPFTAIDKKGVQRLIQHIEQHCQKGGMVIFTSHQTPQSHWVKTFSLDAYKVSS